MNRAQELLAGIQAGGSGEIDQMIATPVTEELFLDYKQSATAAGAKALHQDDRKNLGKAISGFGNSDGGLVIWGVVCKQGPNGDVPSGPAHVHDAVAFKSLLDGAVGGLTIPPHRHVENFAVPVAGGPRGFVVTHVPPGLDVPFCCVDQTSRGFYLRAGSSFQPVPPSILAAMFGRRPNPELELIVRPAFKFTPRETVSWLDLAITAQNRGRGIGESVYLSIHAENGNGLAYDVTYDEATWTQLPSAAHRWLFFTDKLRFPPGSEIRLAIVKVQIASPVEANLKVEARIGVEGGSGDEKQIDLCADTMRKIRENLVHPYETGMQPSVRNVIYELLDTDQTTRQRRYLEIPPYA